MGPSGSGKTTFLNVAGLLDTFDAGTYRLDGEDVSRLSDDQMSRIRNQKIGFIFQSFNLIPDLDVFDNVDVPLRYRGLPAARAQDAHRAGARAGRAVVARAAPALAALGRPAAARGRSPACWPATRKLILADEPTGNLDSLDGARDHGPARAHQRRGHHDRHGHPQPRVRRARARGRSTCSTAGWSTSARRPRPRRRSAAASLAAKIR